MNAVPERDEHGVPPRMFAELARGGGGTAAARELFRHRRRKTTVLLFGVADLARETNHPDAAATVEAFEALGAVPTAASDVVLDFPRVGAWAMRTAAQLAAGAVEAASPGQMSALLAAAMIRAGTSGSVELPGGRSVVLPSLGTFRGVRGPVRVTTGKHGSIAADDVVRTSVSNGRTSHWRPLRRLTASSGGLRLSLTLDGVRDMKLPPHVVARDTLRATELPAWRALAATAWRLLVSRHRAVAEEIASTLFVLTPLATSLPGHDSSLTFSDAFGCVAMSLPRSARHLALTLVHEVQHAKLSVLLDVVELVDSASPQRLRVAWREDLRPPVAVLHGAYAHLAVAAFWRRHDDLEARTEFIRWSSATRAALDALSNAGVLTGSGRLFVAGMREQLDSLTVLGDQCHTMDKKLSH